MFLRILISRAPLSTLYKPDIVSKSPRYLSTVSEMVKRKKSSVSSRKTKATKSESQSQDNTNGDPEVVLEVAAKVKETKSSGDKQAEPKKQVESRSPSKTSFNEKSQEGKTYNLKITTFNVNGLRAWLTKQNGMKFITQDANDILCLQEIKCGNSKVPSEVKQVSLGYTSYWNGAETGQSGVACFSKTKPISTSMGIGIEIYDKECRVITMEFDQFYLVNVYVPNSGRGLVRLGFRQKWNADFLNYLQNLDSKKPVIVCGDLNVSHKPIDLANPQTNTKNAGYTIEERTDFTKLLEDGKFVDIFRSLNPDEKGCYTWWSYMHNARAKDIGWRLDYFLVSERWVKKICDCVIRKDILGSDHCPVTLYLAV